MTGTFSTKLVAIACLVVGMGWLANGGQATARPTQGGDPVSDKMYYDPYCPPRTVCLYPHARLKGKVQRYGCGKVRGKVRQADLSLRFTPGRIGGVSSFKRSPDLPKVTLWDQGTAYELHRTVGRIAGWFDDDARILEITC